MGSAKTLIATMPTISRDIENVRHTDVWCGGSAVKLPESAIMYITESVRHVKHIPVLSQTGNDEV